MNKFKALSSILRVIKFHFNEYSFQDSLTRKDYKATTCRQVFDDSFEDRKMNEIFKIIGLQVKVKKRLLVQGYHC